MTETIDHLIQARFDRVASTLGKADWSDVLARARSAEPAAKYGLVPIGHYNGKLPVTRGGGDWTVHLDGLTSMVSWHAGDSFVTVEDTTPTSTTTTRVPIGHEIPLVSFK